MEKLLTVVIPAYNAEKTLRTTLDSLCVPAFLPELEVIVVNDGSTDRTEAIAGTYAAKYPETVRVITKENGGHGSGVNTGLRKARGEYLKVIDADDWAAEEGLQELLAALKDHRGKDSVDLVSSQFLWAFENDKEDENARKCRNNSEGRNGREGENDKEAENSSEGENGSGDGNGKEDVSNFPTKAQFREPFPGVEYGKVYRFEEICRDLYLKFHNLTFRTELLREHGIVFDEHCYYEDAEVAMYPCLYADTIMFTKEPLYMYRIGRSGQSMDPAKMVRCEANYRKVLEALLKKYKEYKENRAIEESSTGKVNCLGREISNNSDEAGRMVQDDRGNNVSSCDNILCYMESFIARFYAGYIKVLLLLPKGRESLEKLQKAETMLRQQYPAIYEANSNRAVWLLRKSGYLLYDPAATVIRFRRTV